MKRLSHNLQSGHPAWWSADNYNIFSHSKIIFLDFLEARSEPTEEMRNALKIEKNHIMHLCFSSISYLFFGTEMRGKLKHNRTRS